MAVVFYTDHPDQFGPGFVFGGSSGPLTIEGVRAGSGVMVVKFREVADRNAAEVLKGTQLTMDNTDRRELDENEFWPDELVGLTVRDDTGAQRGSVKQVITGGAQDRLVIVTPNGQVEVPFVAALVPVVDLETGFLTVSSLPGLLDPQG